jgi:hypothetical protein
MAMRIARYAVPSRARRGPARYIDAAGIVEDRKGWLFPTARGHNGSSLSDKPMSRTRLSLFMIAPS